MKKYHRVYAEININHIVDNLKNIKAHIGSDTRVMLVIKADGYGHGAIPISKALNEEDIDYIGVATIHEAIALREEGIDLPILVLGYTPYPYYSDLVKYNITQTIYGEDMLEKLSAIAIAMCKVAKVHIKVDTGMNRIGMKPNQALLDYIVQVNQLAGVEIEGLFTHFSKADEGENDYTNNQIDVFNQFLKDLEALGIKAPIVHAANSAGMIDYQSAHKEMVRVGIALYGLYPSEDVSHTAVKLRPSLSLKSNVVYIKDIEAGEQVSYGGIYTAKSRRRIATVPVGYGDGYPRALSNVGRVLINGVYAPIIGRVCMDMFIIDVTDIEGVTIGDLVTLIGQDGDKSITVEEIAKHRETINYEIICQLGKRIPRVYIRDGKTIETVDYF